VPIILESIVTTLDRDGRVNIAPMGPELLDGVEPQFLLRPFEGSTTYVNLLESRRAVIHVTDNALLIARAAIDHVVPEGLGRSMADPLYWRLNDCHRYFAVEATKVSIESPRARLTCRVVDSGTVGPFFGFNRAKHAVIETAILATRTHLLPANEILAELARLRPLIDKTGGADEHTAFELLQKFIDERIRR
jgi:uncharacterized protein